MSPPSTGAISTDFVNRSPPIRSSGGALGWGSVEQVRPIWKDLIECFEIRLQVEGIIAAGNTVVVRYTERGKSVRAFRGPGPAGGMYELTGYGAVRNQGPVDSPSL